MFIRTVMFSIVFLLGLSSDPLQASVSQSLGSASGSVDHSEYWLAAAKSKDRRDNRKDDRGRSDDRDERRDCREEDGAVGKDKRDCKQDSRQGKNDKAETDDK